MKKDLIFAPILLILAGALFFLKFTGLPVHIAVSVVGALVLIAYTVLTKKDWEIPAIEILTRAFYGVALISGVLLMNLHGIKALGIAHKLSAVLFLVGILVLLATKSGEKKKD